VLDFHRWLLRKKHCTVKVVQELVRHASSKTTMDVYAQARMPDKRRAQLRLVKGLRKPPTEKVVGAKDELPAQKRVAGKRTE
jgi:hypothetical protein